MSAIRRIAMSLAVLATASSGHAANWTNANGGNWAYGPWWNTGVVPGTGENVNIRTNALSDFTVIENYGYTPDTAVGDIVVNASLPLEITLNLTDLHSDLYAANETIGDAGHATVKHTGHSTNGISGRLILGKSATGRGTYNFSGFRLEAGGGETIGRAGTGLFTQTLGTNAVTGSDGLRLGESAGGNGLYALNGGTLQVDFTEYLGLSGRGTFTQSAGTNTAGSLFLSFHANAAGGDYALTGGTLNAGYVENHGYFVQTGGSATLNAVNNSGDFASTGGTLAITNSFGNSGTLTLGGTQHWSDNVTLYNYGGSTVFNSDAGSESASPLHVDVSDGSVVFASDQHLASINITGNATATISTTPPGDSAGRKVVVVNSLAVTTAVPAGAGIRIAAAPAHFDITNNELVILNGDLATVAVQIAAGWSNGSGLGPGITSSAADTRHRVGYRALSGGGVVVECALAGDANLDGAVNFTDLVQLAQNYNKPGTYWAGGDFDYDHLTAFADLVALAQNYNTGTVARESGAFSAQFAADWALAQSLVPEPSLVSLLVLPILIGMRRR